MATISQILTQIRTAVFGKDVRENIAQGIEKCYTDVSNGVTLAETAASGANTAKNNANTAADNANTKAGLANTAATNANTAAQNIQSTVNTAVDKIVQIKNQQSQLDSTNKIWIKPTGDEYTIPTMDDVATVADTKSYFGIT